MASRLGLFLRGYRAAKGLDLPTMADRIGISETRLRLIEAGQEFPPASIRQAIACRLGIGGWMDLDALWREEAPTLPRASCGDGAAKVAVINKAPAGEPRDYEEYGLHSGIGADYVDAPPGFEGATLFAFIVVGDSMRGAYEQDDLVFCRPVSPRESLPVGSPVFVRLGARYDNRCTFKLLFPVTPGALAKVVASAELLDLRPTNPAYPTLRVDKQDIAAMGLAVYRIPRYYEHANKPHLVQDEYSQI